MTFNLFHKRTKKSNGVSELQKEDWLKTLCVDDAQLYDAMSNFLLLDPKHQEQHAGSVSQLLEEGANLAAGGSRLNARVDYEIAARLSLFHSDKATLEKTLKLAEENTVGEVRHRMHQTLLSNLDRIIGIAKQYYAKYALEPTKKDAEEEESYLFASTPLAVKR